MDNSIGNRNQDIQIPESEEDYWLEYTFVFSSSVNTKIVNACSFCYNAHCIYLG
jgi:hypothetical protein